MPQSVVEEAVKVLVEFEEALQGVKNEATEARRQLSKMALEEGEKARKAVIASAQSKAGEIVAGARSEAEREAASIIAKGDSSLQDLKAKIAKNRAKAVELVSKRLIGEK